ncbi:hypothetical protein [Planctomicrobium sp. SH664]|uniref:hypothetical protein n=1 Tax=Planctomicrobium sp. SH664 TaxID=3448125 RepID=UPI003F5CA8B2
MGLAGDLWISTASKSDWPYFSRWHYRSHHLGLIRGAFLLWWQEQPIGICIFIAPPKSLSLRNKYFGRSGRWERTPLRTLNSELVMLSRVVIHPTFRGVGISHHFVRRCCELMPYPWIETLTEMGHCNPFFERAGFVRVGICHGREKSRISHSRIYGKSPQHGQKVRLLTPETFRKSRYAQPVYYIFDNRAQAALRKTGQ